MSYSHTTIKETKAEAKADLMRQFDEITVPMFPIHSRDRAAVEANLDAALALVPEDASKHVSASINGFISHQGDEIQSVGVSAYAGLTTPTPPLQP